jgi:RNA-directed DNA polymerase
MKAEANEVRYLDDMVFIFKFRSEAEKFFKVLPKRLAKYGLEMHVDKSQLIPAGNKAALKAHREGKRLPTYKFLGFVCYWSTAGNGQWRLKYMSRPDRFRAKLKGLRSYLWDNLNAPTDLILDQVVRVGWINYHGISDNEKRVSGFIEESSRILFKWTNRKGRKNPMNWETFSKILKKKGFPSCWKTISIFPNELNKGQSLS